MTTRITGPSLSSRANSFARLVARLGIRDVRAEIRGTVFLIANDNRCVSALSASAAVKAWKRNAGSSE